MDERRDPEQVPGQPGTVDLLTIALLVFFVALIVIVAALLILPQLGA